MREKDEKYSLFFLPCTCMFQPITHNQVTGFRAGAEARSVAPEGSNSEWPPALRGVWMTGTRVTTLLTDHLTSSAILRKAPPPDFLKRHFSVTFKRALVSWHLLFSEAFVFLYFCFSPFPRCKKNETKK
ncbi:hypothetical protein CEXT_88141 [Caerostris extrusa]|uniref:Uncharacterized protein n=1 Tax=Caerostris extrusa TaxID=172846 RepID=A0AAV4WHM2_CAEEX|nr:hypothetical protein CEXT_88141 [Caerostris extrusa]